jgi:hypothetical protein
MAITNTIGTFYKPFYNKPNDYTPVKIEILQTSGAIGATTTAEIFADPTTSDDFHLLWITVNYIAPTSTAIARVYAGTDLILSQGETVNTGGSSYIHANYGPVGLMCGTTTTASVSLVCAATLTSATFVAQGYRKV